MRRRGYNATRSNEPFVDVTRSNKPFLAAFLLAISLDFDLLLAVDAFIHSPSHLPLPPHNFPAPLQRLSPFDPRIIVVR